MRPKIITPVQAVLPESESACEKDNRGYNYRDAHPLPALAREKKSDEQPNDASDQHARHAGWAMKAEFNVVRTSG